MSELKNRLIEEFEDKEYAHSYMESFCVDRIAAQVRSLRKHREWSQEDLSANSGIAQERISKIESGDFASLTMKTLQKLSRAFDVHLTIKFESFSNAIEDFISLSDEGLAVESRAEDMLNASKHIIAPNLNSVEMKKLEKSYEAQIMRNERDTNQSNLYYLPGWSTFTVKQAA